MRVEAIENRDPQAKAAGSDRRVILRDAAIIVIVSAVTLIVSLRFDLNEAFFHWSRRFENAQFDELPTVIFVFSAGCVWFAVRRIREILAAAERQRRVEVRLSDALFENRRLARRNVSVQEEERRNIARELHDEMGQYLNAIKIDAISLRDSESRADQDVAAAAAGIARNVDHVYSVVTGLIQRLRPIGLDELGLIAALEHCVGQWRPRLSETEITFAAKGSFAKLNERANLSVYRVVQEALTNIAKHSQAKRVAIDIEAVESNGNSEVVLRIADDGRGVDLRATQSGFGLINMRERIEMHRGQLDVETAPGKGFVVRAKLLG